MHHQERQYLDSHQYYELRAVLNRPISRDNIGHQLLTYDQSQRREPIMPYFNGGRAVGSRNTADYEEEFVDDPGVEEEFELSVPVGVLESHIRKLEARRRQAEWDQIKEEEGYEYVDNTEEEDLNFLEEEMLVSGEYSDSHSENSKSENWWFNDYPSYNDSFLDHDDSEYDTVDRMRID